MEIVVGLGGLILCLLAIADTVMIERAHRAWWRRQGVRKGKDLC
jgi:hypothetical protein